MPDFIVIRRFFSLLVSAPQTGRGIIYNNVFNPHSPYELYGKIDKVYSQEAYYAGEGWSKVFVIRDLGNCQSIHGPELGFGTAQTWMNVVELGLQFGSVYLHYKRHPAAPLVAFTAQLMTLWKTVLYFLSDILGGFAVSFVYFGQVGGISDLTLLKCR